MSLFGLLIGLFSIHLGNWLSKLQAIRTKWEFNNGSEDTEKAARRECKYALAEVFNWQPAVMTIIIAGFGVNVLCFFNGVRIAGQVTFPSGYVTLYNAFFVIMIALQAVLLIWGYAVAVTLNGDVAKVFPKKKRQPAKAVAPTSGASPS